MAFKRNGFSRGCIHSVFEQEQFFIKVVDAGVPTFFVFFFAHVVFGRDVGVENFGPGKTAVVKGACDADGADRIESVCVLHHIQFGRVEFRGFFASFEGDVFDDFYDVIDLIVGKGFWKRGLGLGLEEVFGGCWSNGFIAIVKL